jgi:hypothetical protein
MHKFVSDGMVKQDGKGRQDGKKLERQKRDKAGEWDGIIIQDGIG